jgi:hypothetical protein
MRSRFKSLFGRHPVLVVSVLLLGAVLIVLGTRLFFKGGVALLTVLPDRIDQCASPNIAVEVSWYAPRQPFVKIYTSHLGEPTQLWLSSAARGNAKTGAWVTDGSSIVITDPQGRTLARRTVTSVDCGPGAPHPEQVAALAEP